MGGKIKIHFVDLPQMQETPNKVDTTTSAHPTNRRGETTNQVCGIPPIGMNSEVASTTLPSGSTSTTNDPTTTTNADYAANVPPETLANCHPKPGVKLTMQSINVCGLKGKLEIKEFRETLERHDISLLSETKLDNADIRDRR